MSRGRAREGRGAQAAEGRRAPTVLLGALLAGALGATAARPVCAAPWGVPLGPRAVKASIDGADDVDSYLVEAAAGARLDLRVGVRGASDLVPHAVLLGPDGTPSAEPFVAAGRGLRLVTTAALTGRHELRVSGQGGGAYTVAARVRGKMGLDARDATIGSGAERAFAFAAAGGARLTFSARGAPAAAAFVRITGPGGLAVPVDEHAIRSRVGRLDGRGIEVPDAFPFGEYALVLRSNGAALQGLRVRVNVRGGGLVATRGALPASEPVIAKVEPGEGGAGARITLGGAGFVTTRKRPLRVFVGGVEADEVEVVSAAAAGARVPDGLAGTCDIAILNGDGHAARLADAFVALRTPRPTSFAPARGPAGGGTLVTIRGTDFRPGAAVTVSGTAFLALTEYVDATTLRFRTPAFAGGPQTLGVRDPSGLEAELTTPFEFVAAPYVLSLRPPLVPLLEGERVRIDGGGFADGQTLRIGGALPDEVVRVDVGQLDALVPDVGAGRHTVEVADEFGQRGVAPQPLGVFRFVAGPALESTGGPAPSDVGLADFDGDGDLDVFVVSAGGAALATSSLLRVLRNDGDAFTDVTADVVPAVGGDDWRADAIAFGDVAGDVGDPAPDGHVDIVLASHDSTALAAGGSRIRILANRAGQGGGRVFVDRTSVLMSATTAADDWRASDVWIGDLDGDGGVADIVASHDAVLSSESPLPPYYVEYVSGTRVFAAVTDDGSGYTTFAWDAARMPHVTGTRQPTTGFPQCGSGECADDFTPFRGGALAVADFDGDGRRDVAVTSSGDVRVQGARIASTQLGRNALVAGAPRVLDTTSVLSVDIAPLAGDIVLAGDVAGSTAPDLVVVRRAAPLAGLAVDIVENRGLEATWALRSRDVLPAADGSEHLQADAAALADVDGDGDLDLVLATRDAPTGGATTTGRGLRLLRNAGAAGFSRVLETLLPEAAGDEDWSATSLAVGDLADDGGLALVLVRPDAAGTGAVLRTVLRTTTAE